MLLARLVTMEGVEGRQPHALRQSIWRFSSLAQCTDRRLLRPAACQKGSCTPPWAKADQTQASCRGTDRALKPWNKLAGCTCCTAVRDPCRRQRSPPPQLCRPAACRPILPSPVHACARRSTDLWQGAPPAGGDSWSAPGWTAAPAPLLPGPRGAARAPGCRRSSGTTPQ